ncbi:MAG: AMP-binding protein [Steroidobacter sp.]
MKLPLINAADASPLVWRNNQCITRAGFVHAAQQLAERLPDGTHIINLCASRLGFMLGWIAAALRGQSILLPPNQTAGALQLLQQRYPGQSVINDSCLEHLDWQSTTQLVPIFDAEQIIATLFTSGSTGTPQAHTKTWSSLTRTAQLDTQRCAPKPVNLVATVPSQHMFGLQTTVLLPLLGGCTIYDGKPFFPADIRIALESIPAPRALVTTPTHLRTFLASNLQVPELEFVLSATAPMPEELARQTERMWHTSVLEFYGSTEAGAIGTRRTTEGDAWLLHPGTAIIKDTSGTHYHAAHLSAPLLLNDQIELLDQQRFRLLGRDADQVKIAGKRDSLLELTHALLAIPGVADGVIFMPPDAERTAALVVAPGINTAHILDELARSMDAVFLPRPLIMLDKLPRNEVGKLTQAALMNALQAHT